MSDQTLTLEAVEAAITAIMTGGQSYKIGTRSLTRANLSELKALRNQLLEEQNAADSDSAGAFNAVAVGIFSGR
ncbi:peptidylprolyl isomerase [Eubacterium pyruvativorans]|uniref:peptidylprolyl isomerase n=1 Tax=Eubacterium pyruvativorans TaxID=155865 RepID=UPI0015657B66|nr:peptidylprolyl isomerase [Eubacterium pyruvativorans]